jgi:pimeloyl-ACP methyl ester carboxylesterase
MKQSTSHRNVVLLILLAVAAAPLAAGVTEVSGVTGEGASYLFLVPDGQDGDHWNGRVVYYAHGYQIPKIFPGPSFVPQPFLEDLVELGFAVAQSSYSQTGWAVEQAIREMHQLRGLFHAAFGVPDRSYLMGRSMGGLIVVGLAEKHPAQYDGALPICGAVGGAHLVIDQIWGARAAFDFFYPGALPGHAFDVPDALGFNEAFGAVQTAVFGDPTGALQLAGESSLDIDAIDFVELFLNLAIRIGVQAEGTSDLVARGHGHVPYDNVDVIYDVPSLDAGIQRFASTPDAERYYDHHFEPSGRIGMPVLSVHNTRDPLVPIAHEERFAQVVDSVGNGELLVRQTVDRFGHCEFRSQEVVDAFLGLVDWVENGVEPTPGDITVP